MHLLITGGRVVDPSQVNALEHVRRRHEPNAIGRQLRTGAEARSGLRWLPLLEGAVPMVIIAVKWYLCIKLTSLFIIIYISFL